MYQCSNGKVYNLSLALWHVEVFQLRLRFHVSGLFLLAFWIEDLVAEVQGLYLVCCLCLMLHTYYISKAFCLKPRSTHFCSISTHNQALLYFLRDKAKSEYIYLIRICCCASLSALWCWIHFSVSMGSLWKLELLVSNSQVLMKEVCVGLCVLARFCTLSINKKLRNRNPEV